MSFGDTILTENAAYADVGRPDGTRIDSAHTNPDATRSYIDTGQPAGDDTRTTHAQFLDPTTGADSVRTPGQSPHTQGSLSHTDVTCDSTNPAPVAQCDTVQGDRA